MIAIPSSDYHKSFSSHLIHNFILLCRKTFEENGFKCFQKDQQWFNTIDKSIKPPFDTIISMGFVGLTNELYSWYKKHDVKIIIFQDDIHGKDDADKRKKYNWMRKADVLLIPYYENFLNRKEYAICHNKAINFPWFAPEECFTYTTSWKSRQNKIFLSGCMAPIYSIRRNIREFSKNFTKIDVLDHPGYKRRHRKHQIIGSKYYELMSKYKCAIATSADNPLDYPLSKFFEVPACGCLGLFEDIPSIKNLGFIPNSHYIPINNKNYKEVIHDINFNNKQLIDMTNLCRKFILENHTDKIRANQLVEIIKNNRVCS